MPQVSQNLMKQCCTWVLNRIDLLQLVSDAALVCADTASLGEVVEEEMEVPNQITVGKGGCIRLATITE